MAEIPILTYKGCIVNPTAELFKENAEEEIELWKVTISNNIPLILRGIKKAKKS